MNKKYSQLTRRGFVQGMFVLGLFPARLPFSIGSPQAFAYFPRQDEIRESTCDRVTRMRIEPSALHQQEKENAMTLDHLEGFENEKKWDAVFKEAYCDCPNIKRKTVEKIIAHFDPDYIKDLYKARKCVRKLKYIGCGCEEPECTCQPNPFFEIGKIYESIDFTGATYTIKGYKRGERRIGLA